MQGKEDKKESLLRWCRERTSGYAGVNLTASGLAAFSRPWNDGLAFCALLHSYAPDKIGPFDRLDASDAAARERNFELAFRVAGELGVPDLIDVEDMLLCYPKPDSKSVFLYVTTMFNKLRDFHLRPSELAKIGAAKAPAAAASVQPAIGGGARALAPASADVQEEPKQEPKLAPLPHAAHDAHLRPRRGHPVHPAQSANPAPKPAAEPERAPPEPPATGPPETEPDHQQLAAAPPPEPPAAPPAAPPPAAPPQAPPPPRACLWAPEPEPEPAFDLAAERAAVRALKRRISNLPAETGPPAAESLPPPPPPQPPAYAAEQIPAAQEAAPAAADGDAPSPFFSFVRRFPTPHVSVATSRPAATPAPAEVAPSRGLRRGGGGGACAMGEVAPFLAGAPPSTGSGGSGGSGGS
jgi:hypothetical protein